MSRVRVSAKVDYALRATIELAAAAPEQVKGERLAAAQAIPQKFLENILVDLRHGGLVASQRGADGGYRLARARRRDHRRGRDPGRRRPDRERPRREPGRDQLRRERGAAARRLDRPAHGDARGARADDARRPRRARPRRRATPARRRDPLREGRVPGGLDVDDLPGCELVQLGVIPRRLHREALAVRRRGARAGR